MAVYVDNMRARYGRMIMCHMLADSEAELLAMTDTIDVDRRWYQQPGRAKTSTPHFDICLRKKALAIRAGALEVRGQRLLVVIRTSREWWKKSLQPKLL